MTTSLIASLQDNYTIAQPTQNYHSQYCSLQWRRGQLLVKSPEKLQQPYLPALDNEQLLVECLKNSPVMLVTIDPKLGNNALQFWADACKKAQKPIFLHLPSKHKLSTPNNQILRIIQRLTDWLLALILLILISPLMLGLFILMGIQFSELPFSYEWHIGERGKLFQTIKFCTNTKQSFIPLGLWITKYSLENLPMLFNVIRGEMSLLGYSCWSLDDAVKLSPEVKKQQLYRLPGLIKLWQIETKLKPARLS
ncbi:sugar transferase [Anabaena cylindrica FACHB-243]|uniref:Sugar transferase n=1 Tax=Anabaena cylindrica (strain ATCC 27899 / PCC 7122) TaxID=272123 RepID=K9ZBX3_ANACC|nr:MULTISPECIES: heterocyst development glycosyltransferase HepC [Anabaena]AFZ55885.1 sugar transferase [Anabaena cylindrica PCC 7122]MBD2421308.1 sugar transferase [Anabaena cylindrica FACHB-243]MBY5280878.1 sugar transferase [Anabaena sp. CCAP 1446/1C]MBY5310002.1 sugar transferase [Anabaena sp. CCAP 1446/1C]MCM2406640.1 sugar transferase [Anabaena sp. CCAP 1446/1C]